MGRGHIGEMPVAVHDWWKSAVGADHWEQERQPDIRFLNRLERREPDATYKFCCDRLIKPDFAWSKRGSECLHSVNKDWANSMRADFLAIGHNTELSIWARPGHQQASITDVRCAERQCKPGWLGGHEVAECGSAHESSCDWLIQHNDTWCRFGFSQRKCVGTDQFDGV